MAISEHLPASICGVLVSIAGWFMTTYTASLLAATSTPLWAAAPQLLAVRFASSSMATGAVTVGSLALLTRPGPKIILAIGLFAIQALLVELTAALSARSVYRATGVHAPLSRRARVSRRAQSTEPGRRKKVGGN